MFYPEWLLPADLHTAVLTAVDGAESDLRECVRTGSKRYGPDLALEYIEKVFAVFAHQACEAQRQGHLTGRQVRDHVEEFLPLLFRHAFDLAKVGTVYKRDAPWDYQWDFKQYADEALRTSNAWTEHLTERREMAEPPAQTKSSTITNANATPPGEPTSPRRAASVNLKDHRRMLVTQALRQKDVQRVEFLRTNDITTDILRGVINSDSRRVNLARWTPKILLLLDITEDEWNTA